MALQTSGAISFQDLVNEFGTGTPISLEQLYAGAGLVPDSNANVPKSGAISLGDFYGAASMFVLNHIVSKDVFNLNTTTLLNVAGWNGVTPVVLTISINSGIVVSGNDTSVPALVADTKLPATSTISIINNGYIIGMGGNGGRGARAGTTGGTAIKTVVPISISNLGTIGGGGGGGAGYNPTFGGGSADGGGGRSGRMNSTGAYAGTFDSAGNGGSRAGSGGDWGASGGSASRGTAGAGGNAVEGNSYITWITTGTIKGAIT